MASGSSGDEEAALSDFEDEVMEATPVDLQNSPSTSDSERLKEMLAELESEKQARKASDDAKVKLEEAFNKLKIMARDSFRSRDEANRQRKELLQEKEDLARQLKDALKGKEEAVGKCNDALRAKEEASKIQEASRSEIEATAQMLVTGIGKISNRVSSIKNFGGLPRSSSHSGLAAVAYGAIKRAEEIVDELLRQNEVKTKERNDVHEQMEQRNIQIAIEVSQLEATMIRLKEDLQKKTDELEELQAVIPAKDRLIMEMKSKMSERLREKGSEFESVKKSFDEVQERLRNLEMKMKKQKCLVSDQLDLVSKTEDFLKDILVRFDDGIDMSEPLMVSEDLEVDKDYVTLASRMMFISDLAESASKNFVQFLETSNQEKKDLEDNILSLEAEKRDITALLRSTLGERTMLNKEPLVPSDGSATNDIAEAASISSNIKDCDHQSSQFDSSKEQKVNHDSTKGEVLGLASALENIVRKSQLEILELRRSLGDAMGEIDRLKKLSEVQAKDIVEKETLIQELERKEKVATKKVAGLLSDLATADDEINRWREAAEKEAAAGESVMEELQIEITSLKHSLEEMKQSLDEAHSKLKSKEEIAAAAVAARDMAEKSLNLADERASRLRSRIEELTKQLEELDGRDDGQSNRSMRYKCWPMQWLGVDTFRTQLLSYRSGSNPAEMELSDPLL